MHAAEDDTVFGAEGEYSGGGEPMAGHFVVDIAGHEGSVVVVAVIFLAEAGVFKSVLVGGVGASAGVEGMVFEG